MKPRELIWPPTSPGGGRPLPPQPDNRECEAEGHVPGQAALPVLSPRCSVCRQASAYLGTLGTLWFVLCPCTVSALLGSPPAHPA